MSAPSLLAQRPFHRGLHCFHSLLVQTSSGPQRDQLKEESSVRLLLKVNKITTRLQCLIYSASLFNRHVSQEKLGSEGKHSECVSWVIHTYLWNLMFFISKIMMRASSKAEFMSCDYYYAFIHLSYFSWINRILDVLLWGGAAGVSWSITTAASLTSEGADSDGSAAGQTAGTDSVSNTITGFPEGDNLSVEKGEVIKIWR